MKSGKVSVIIRTYNEEKKIGECLKAVFNQNYKNIEVIIVDSESTDNTLKIASKFPVKIIKIKKKDFTYGKALNIGCKAAKGKYLVFLSAHAIPVGNKWLSVLIENFKNKKVAGVYGRQIPAKNCNPLTKRQLSAYWKNKDKKTIQSNDPSFHNAFSIIQKKLWDKIKFNEKIESSEDSSWASEVQKKSYLIVYEPKAVVMHSHNETLKQLYKRYYREYYYMLSFNNKKIFRYFSDGPYNFLRDILYILEKRHNLFWIISALFNNLLLELAVLNAFLKSS